MDSEAIRPKNEKNPYRIRVFWWHSPVCQRSTTEKERQLEAMLDFTQNEREILTEFYTLREHINPRYNG